MTLCAALKYEKGTVLATDTRVMIGDMKRDGGMKIELLTPDMGVATAGLTGATDDIVMSVREGLKAVGVLSFDVVLTRLSDEALRWYKTNREKLNEEDEDEPYVFILASATRVRRVDVKGYSEEVWDYDCDGAGKPYGEYILQNHYREKMSEEEAKELAAYAILETAKIDPSVGDRLQLMVFPVGEAAKAIGEEEMESIKLKLAPMSRTYTERQIKTVGTIIDHRSHINDLWHRKFKFRLFLPSEKAVFQIMKPCRDEEEFTINIAALAFLVEEVDAGNLSKVAGKTEGTINLLEAFLKGQLDGFPSQVIATFRDIYAMRSKKYPIHKTKPEFVDIVVRITGAYPPKWSELYLKTLDLYAESLTTFLGFLSGQEKIDSPVSPAGQPT